ncbi:DUF4129 domain-containing protein, partial [Deinococcus sp.]|uniref:DUF4129 domain-containing protein n=1 Tax=Deinococcus sp. TaxID=47478 RepID=UPI0025F0AD49
SSLRPWLSVLLPLTALGLLPWSICAAQVLALTLARLSDDSRSVGWLLVVLGATAAALTQWPNLYLTGTFWAYGLALGTGALLSLGVLEGGRWIGMVPGLVVLLVAPTPIGLAALLLSALSLAGMDSRAHRSLERGAALVGVLGTVIGLVAVVGALSLLLPTPTPVTRSPASIAVPAPPRPVASQPLPQVTGGPGPLRPRTRSVVRGSSAALFETLTPLAGLLLVICIWLTLRRAQAKKLIEGKSNWTDYVAVAGMAALLIMLLILSLGVRGGGGGSAGEAVTGTLPTEAGAPVRPSLETTVQSPGGALFLNVLAVLAVLIFGAMAVLLWKLQPPRTALAGKESEALDEAPALPPSAPPPPAPLHRVRLAWQRAERELSRSGLGRSASETPQEATRRWAQALPDAAAELSTLSALYQPVRYGGVVGETDADQADADLAETAAAHIIQTVQQHSSEAPHD